MSTLHSTAIVPGLLTDKEVVEASLERSRNRIASLVWIHPSTKAPLTRSSQPLAGMSGNSNEADRKFCLGNFDALSADECAINILVLCHLITSC